MMVVGARAVFSGIESTSFARRLEPVCRASSFPRPMSNSTEPGACGGRKAPSIGADLTRLRIGTASCHRPSWYSAYAPEIQDGPPRARAAVLLGPRGAASAASVRADAFVVPQCPVLRADPTKHAATTSSSPICQSHVARAAKGRHRCLASRRPAPSAVAEGRQRMSLDVARSRGAGDRDRLRRPRSSASSGESGPRSETGRARRRRGPAPPSADRTARGEPPRGRGQRLCPIPGLACVPRRGARGGGLRGRDPRPRRPGRSPPGGGAPARTEAPAADAALASARAARPIHARAFRRRPGPGPTARVPARTAAAHRRRRRRSPRRVPPRPRPRARAGGRWPPPSGGRARRRSTGRRDRIARIAPARTPRGSGCARSGSSWP